MACSTGAFPEENLEGCVDHLNQAIFGFGALPDIKSCCATNLEAPYCAFHNCLDLRTGELTDSYSYTVVVNVYRNASSPLYTPLLYGLVDSSN